ncbi:MAG: hypothetical protein ACTSX0_04405, partial [Promethearchaeota archaeon]
MGKRPRAFIVYSSSKHVPYIDKILSIINSVLQNNGFIPVYLDDGFYKVNFLPQMLQKNINESDFGIVVLDGLRPNVAYE